MTALALRAMDRPRDALKCVLRVLKINPDNEQAGGLKGELEAAVKSRPREAPKVVQPSPAPATPSPVQEPAPMPVQEPAPQPAPSSNIDVEDVETVNMD